MTRAGSPTQADRDSASGLAGDSLEGAAVRRALVESNDDLRRFLIRRLGSAEEAEEVRQHFMVRALDKAHQLRDVRTVRGWLGRILASTIVDHQRRAIGRRRREVVSDPEALEAIAVEPDDDADRAVCQCLYKLLPTLRPAYNEIIWRVDLLGEPRERVAVTLGLSLNALNVRLHRGRQALKRRLEAMCSLCSEHGFLDCRCPRLTEPPARARAGSGGAAS